MGYSANTLKTAVLVYKFFSLVVIEKIATNP